jgi:hypothetical protein
MWSCGSASWLRASPCSTSGRRALPARRARRRSSPRLPAALHCGGTGGPLTRARRAPQASYLQPHAVKQSRAFPAPGTPVRAPPRPAARWRARTVGACGRAACAPRAPVRRRRRAAGARRRRRARPLRRRWARPAPCAPPSSAARSRRAARPPRCACSGPAPPASRARGSTARRARARARVLRVRRGRGAARRACPCRRSSAHMRPMSRAGRLCTARLAHLPARSRPPVSRDRAARASGHCLCRSSCRAHTLFSAGRAAMHGARLPAQLRARRAEAVLHRWWQPSTLMEAAGRPGALCGKPPVPFRRVVNVRTADGAMVTVNAQPYVVLAFDVPPPRKAARCGAARGRALPRSVLPARAMPGMRAARACATARAGRGLRVRARGPALLRACAALPASEGRPPSADAAVPAPCACVLSAAVPAHPFGSGTHRAHARCW